MNILISSAGRRVSLVRAFQKELKKIDPESKVYASDANPILAAACQVADGHFEVPLQNEPDYFTVLIEKCKEYGIDLIIPTIDAELLPLSKNRELLKENGIEAVISATSFIEKCRDKRQIHDFFKSCQVQTAHEYEKDNYELPLFIKPIDGSRSIDTYLIRKEDELKEYHFTNDKLMFLEYLDHAVHDEFTCDLYYGKDHKLITVVPRKRLEVRDGEVYKALTSKNHLLSFIRERLSFIEGAVGCLTAQFFVHQKNSKTYGIEINPRFGGGYPLSYLAGANFPKWIIDEYFLGRSVEENFDCWEDGLLMLRYDDEILVHGYKG